MRFFCCCARRRTTRSRRKRTTASGASSKKTTVRAFCRHRRCAAARKGPDHGRLHQRHVIVFAHALQYEKSGGTLAAVDDQMRAPRHNGVSLANLQYDFLFRLAYEQANRAFEHVKRIADVAVKV